MATTTRVMMTERMSRRALAVLALVSMLVPARLVHAGVSIDIGINLPGPPQLAPVPGTPVMYAPAVDSNYFFYAGSYYAFVNGGWYVSPGYGGPWAVVAPEFVPRPILAVPVGYYRVRPPAWRSWRRQERPHWESRWGRSWAERPRGHARRHDHR